MSQRVSILGRHASWIGIIPGIVLLALLAPSIPSFAQSEMYPLKEGVEQPIKWNKMPKWMTFNMELRGRTEDQTALNYVTDKGRLYELTRVRGGLEIRPTSWLTMYGQFQDAHALGLPVRDVAANMRDTFDLRQGYLNFHYNTKIQLFAGRQELRFGDERVVGISDWTNVSRTWDGFDLRLDYGKIRTDIFSTSVVLIHPTSLDTHGAGLTFHGVESKIMATPNTSIMPFVLIRTSPRVLSQQKTYGSETEVTFGSEWNAALPWGFSTSGMGDLQRGSYSNDSIHAGAGIARARYSAKALPWKPSLEGEYDYSTGNAHQNPLRISTYDQQYPSSHNAFGLVDLFGFQNLKQDRLNLTLTPRGNFEMLFQTESLHVATTHDGLYTGAGGTLFSAPTNGFLHDDVGTGFDASAKYIFHRSTVVNIGVGHFFPGYVMTSQSHGAPLTLAYFQLTYRFHVAHSSDAQAAIPGTNGATSAH